MSVGRITSRSVDAIKHRSSIDVFLWDSEIAGFGVRVTCGGAKSYIYQYRLGGRGTITKRFTIGRHRSPWTARTARAKALRLAAQVQRGKDPVAKRRERRRREVELRFDRYVELFTDNYLKRRWKDWRRIHDMLVHYAVPTLGTKKLADIRRADLAAIYHQLDNTPSVARAMHAALRKMLRWAMSRDDLKHSPVDGVEVPPPLRPRSRYLSEIELSAAWETSSSLPSTYRSAFRLMILTGQRRGEIVGLQWNELDRDRAEWRLPVERSKNRRAHLVPLNSAAIAELDGLAEGKEWPAGGLVLPSSRGTPLSGFSKIKRDWDRRIAARLSREQRCVVTEPWRLHDLRRTVATGMQMLHISTAVVEAVLNHLSGVRAGIVGVYQCYDFQAEKRAALDAWGQHVLELGSPNFK